MRDRKIVGFVSFVRISGCGGSRKHPNAQKRARKDGRKRKFVETKTNPAPLDVPPDVDLVGVASIEALASTEGWTADSYVLALSKQLRDPHQPLDVQLARLQALAGVGAAAASASSDELARHVVLLSAVFERLMIAVSKVDPTTSRGADVTERVLRAAVRCQRAAGASLGALSALRVERRQPDNVVAVELAGAVTSASEAA